MKAKILFIFSVVCILAALVVGFVVPVLADNGASIQKLAVYNGNGTVTETISVTNNNSSATITVTSITDSQNHNSGSPNPELSGELLPGGLPVTINAGATYSVAWTFALRPDDYGKTLQDTATVAGTNNALTPPGAFILTYPAQFSVPVPEASAGILFGIGTLGLGGFVLINRKKSTAKV